MKENPHFWLPVGPKNFLKSKFAPILSKEKIFYSIVIGATGSQKGTLLFITYRGLCFSISGEVIIYGK